MSAIRRISVVLTGAGLLGAAALVPMAVPEYAVAQIKIQVKGVPVPIGAPAVPAPGGVVPGAPVEKEPEFTDAITLPTDRKASRSIGLAEDFIKEEDWVGAAETLQGLLDGTSDVFMQVRRKGPDTKSETVHWASVKSEANRLIGTMPANGLQVYELRYGARAKERLAEAKARGDREVLAEVAQRYLHTQAGFEATGLLGTYSLSRGEFLSAAMWYERMVNHEKADKLPPATLLKATLAFRRVAAQQGGAEQAWGRLAQRTWSDFSRVSPAGFRIGDRNVDLDELQKELDRGDGTSLLVSIYDWPEFRGNSSRSAQGNGGAPFLEVKWRAKEPKFQDDLIIRDSLTKTWVEDGVKSLRGAHKPVLPALFPIAAAGKLIYRSYWGIHAVDLKTGEMVWRAQSQLAPDYLASDDTDTQRQLQLSVMKQWQQQWAGQMHILFENSLLGTLSTDNKLVYAIDDMPIPPPPGIMQPMMWGQQPQFGVFSDAVAANKLTAFGLESGKLEWELGGKSQGELGDSYFLGAPLPLAGKLYVLNEKNGEMRLICLDPAKKSHQGENPIVWMQTLANVRDKMLMDPGRRLQGANLSFGEGILVCPTNAGAILGVDLLSHSLVWAYSYREDGNQQDPNAQLRARGVWMGQQMLQTTNPEWKVSAPVIQDGKVVFTAPDASSVHCIDLRNGTRLWKSGRGDDLYLGGVYHGKVLLVGANTCRALNLADGKQAWVLETGQPSGQGVASDNVYYLPLKADAHDHTPEVAAIDIDKGAFVGHTKARLNPKDSENALKDGAPGNLLFYEGDVISQTAAQVIAYPQLKLVLAKIDQELARDPNDPTGLTRRGELRLFKGDALGAVEDLHAALKNTPPADVQSKARTKLFEALTELFRKDFNASEKYLDEYREMCKVPIPPGASPTDKASLEAEQKRRFSDFFYLLGKGRENQGQLVKAFDAYREFGDRADAAELVPVLDEPALKARANLWAQGRIAAMLARATPDQRRPLEERIDQEWEKARTNGSTEEVRRFVDSFGAVSAAGREARLYLAERLIGDGVFLEAELHLQRLRNQDDAPTAGRAVEMLARLNLKRRLFEDAAYYYRILGRDFADTVIRDGKTGADFFKDLPTDPRLLPYFEETSQVWNRTGRFRVKEEASGGYYQEAQQQAVTFETEGETLPFFRHYRLAAVMNQLQINLYDRATNKSAWNVPLAAAQPNGRVAFYFNPYNMVNARHTIRPQGHLVVMNYGSSLYGLDLAARQKLWDLELLGQGFAPGQQLMPDGNGGLQLFFNNGQQPRKVLQMGPTEASYACVLTLQGLTVLDPLTKATLWTKADVPIDSQMFGDDQHLYLIEARPSNNTFGAVRAFRARDGSSVPVPDFSELYARKLRILGRNLLVADTDSRTSKVTYRLYDVQTGKDRWKKEYTAGAILLQTEDPELVAVVEPGGKLTATDLHTRKQVLEAAVKVEDIPAGTDGHLLQDDTQFYVLFNKPQEARADVNFWVNQIPGMRRATVNGMVYAFYKSGEVNWKYKVPSEFLKDDDCAPSQMLILEQFRDLPILLFAIQYNKMNNGRGMNTPYTAVMSIDKRTGCMVCNEKYTNVNNANYYFNSLVSNPRDGFVELVSYNRKLRFSLEADTAAAAVPQRKDAATNERKTEPAPAANPKPGGVRFIGEGKIEIKR